MTNHFFRDRWLIIVVALIGVTMAALSVLRYTGYNAGMLDLGNMSQAIWSATRGRPLEFTYKLGSYSRLALHVELFYFLLAPLYVLLPSPVTLLVFQAFWFAAGAFPLFALAQRRLEHTRAARWIVLIYLLYPVALTAVLFDVHGDTLAMPALLWMLDALDRRAWRAYGVWMALALSCKFYVAVPVAVLGALLYLQAQPELGRQRRVGILTAAAAGLWGAVAFLLIRPFFSPTDMVEVQATALGYFSFYFGRIRELLLGHNIARRLMTALVVFMPALWLGWRAFLWLLPAAVIALPSLMSVGSVSAYDYRFHHYAVAVPFLLRAIVEGAAVLRQRQRAVPVGQRVARPWRWDVAMTLGITLLFSVILIDIPLNPWFWIAPPGWGLDDRAYGRTVRDAFKDAWLRANVPDAVPVATSMYLAPHLVNRETLYLFEYSDGVDLQPMAQRLASVDYALADALFDYTIPAPETLGEQTGVPPISAIAGIGHQPSSVGGVGHDVAAIRYLLQQPDFGLVAAQDGLVLFQRDALPEARLVQTATLRQWPGDGALRFDFGNGIGLAEAEVASVQSDRRLRLSLRWVNLAGTPMETPLFAVSHLEGVQNARVAHLPTLALHPVSTWPAGAEVEEVIETRLPAALAPGRYQLFVAWYDARHIDAGFTDARSRVGASFLLAVVEVP